MSDVITTRVYDDDDVEEEEEEEEEEGAVQLFSIAVNNSLDIRLCVGDEARRREERRDDLDKYLQ